MDPLERAAQLSAREGGLAVAVTSNADGSVQASVVNAGVLDHPVTGERIVGFASRGRTRKLRNLRERPRVTVVFRSGWEWVAVEGDADIAGPDDHLEGLEPAELPALLREVYAAAVGGTAEQWVGLDAAIAAERHAAVLVRVARTYSNPAAGQ